MTALPETERQRRRREPLVRGLAARRRDSVSWKLRPVVSYPVTSADAHQVSDAAAPPSGYGPPPAVCPVPDADAPSGESLADTRIADARRGVIGDRHHRPARLPTHGPPPSPSNRSTASRRPCPRSHERQRWRRGLLDFAAAPVWFHYSADLPEAPVFRARPAAGAADLLQPPPVTG